jgi:hypothetical protein
VKLLNGRVATSYDRWIFELEGNEATDDPLEHCRLLPLVDRLTSNPHKWKPKPSRRAQRVLPAIALRDLSLVMDRAVELDREDGHTILSIDHDEVEVPHKQQPPRVGIDLFVRVALDHIGQAWHRHYLPRSSVQ